MVSDIDHPYLRSQLTILGHKLRSCLFFRVGQDCESCRLLMLESMNKQLKLKNVMKTDFDLSAYWMPYTGNRQFKRDPRMIESASGVWFTDADGRQVLDGHSGLWTSGLGHARPEITEAVSRQMAELDFCPPFQFGHPKAFELATKIADLMPGDLNHVFYTNSGSESADTSLKMARAYWQLKGETRKTRFIGRLKGYHGVNYGGVAVGGIPATKQLFGEVLDTAHLSHTILPENALTRGMPPPGATRWYSATRRLIACLSSSSKLQFSSSAARAASIMR